MGGSTSEDATEEVSGSTAADCIETEPNAEQLEAWRALRQKASDAAAEHRISLLHVETGPTRSAYDHGQKCGPCVTWRLDHIFFSPRNLCLRSSWTALESEPQA